MTRALTEESFVFPTVDGLSTKATRSSSLTHVSARVHRTLLLLVVHGWFSLLWSYSSLLWSALVMLVSFSGRALVVPWSFSSLGILFAGRSLRWSFSSQVVLFAGRSLRWSFSSLVVLFVGHSLHCYCEDL